MGVGAILIILAIIIGLLSRRLIEAIVFAVILSTVLIVVVLNSSMKWNEVLFHTTPVSYSKSATPLECIEMFNPSNPAGLIVITKFWDNLCLSLILQ